MADLDEEILEFVIKCGNVRWSELEKVFVKSGKCSHGTLVYRVGKLRASGNLDKRLDEGRGRPVYFVPEEHGEEPKLPMAKVKLEEGVKKTYVIAAYARMNPHIKYSAIADKFGVKGTHEQKKSYVKQCVNRLKRGKIRLTREQIERIAAEYA